MDLRDFYSSQTTDQWMPSPEGSWQGATIVELVPNDPCSSTQTTSSPLSLESSRMSTPSMPSLKSRRKEQNKVAILAIDERCRVCGDKSTGIHYEIASCNGCKSFFRRTLLEKRKFICEGSNNCNISPKVRVGQKRRQCRACRFNQCISAGMNPLSIVAETEEDRETLQMALGKLQTKKLSSVGDQVNSFLYNLMYIEFRHQALRRSNLNPYPTSAQTVLDILMRSAALGQPQEDMQGWPLAQTDSRAVISLEEHVQLRIPLPRFRALPASYKFWFYTDLVCTIEWAKTLDFFRGLDLEDQRSLICSSALQIVNLTLSYFSFLKCSDRVLFPDGKFSVWSPREADRDVILPLTRLKINQTEYLLLKSLVLCNSSSETISEHSRLILHKEREKLTKLLLNHCMKTQGKDQGAARFGEIVAIEGTLLHQALKAKHLQSLLVALKLRSTRIVLLDEICDMDYFL